MEEISLQCHIAQQNSCKTFIEEKHRRLTVSAWERSCKELSGRRGLYSFLGEELSRLAWDWRDYVPLACLSSGSRWLLKCSLGRIWKLEILRGGAWPQKCLEVLTRRILVSVIHLAGVRGWDKEERKFPSKPDSGAFT